MYQQFQDNKYNDNNLHSSINFGSEYSNIFNDQKKENDEASIFLSDIEYNNDDNHLNEINNNDDLFFSNIDKKELNDDIFSKKDTHKSKHSIANDQNSDITFLIQKPKK